MLGHAEMLNMDLLNFFITKKTCFKSFQIVSYIFNVCATSVSLIWKNIVLTSTTYNIIKNISRSSSNIMCAFKRSQFEIQKSVHNRTLIFNLVKYSLLIISVNLFAVLYA